MQENCSQERGRVRTSEEQPCRSQGFEEEEQDLLQEPELRFPAQGEAAVSLLPMGPREVQKSPGDPTREQEDA